MHLFSIIDNLFAMPVNLSLKQDGKLWSSNDVIFCDREGVMFVERILVHHARYMRTMFSICSRRGFTYNMTLLERTGQEQIVQLEHRIVNTKIVETTGPKNALANPYLEQELCVKYVETMGSCSRKQSLILIVNKCYLEQGPTW